MDSLICGIHHAALKCGSIEKFEETLSFYQNVLGLKLVRSWGEGLNAGAMLSTGDSLLEIFAGGDLLPQGTIHHFALRTTNTDACVTAVRQAGYPITVEPKEIVIASEPPFPARIAFSQGPLGEVIEFFQER